LAAVGKVTCDIFFINFAVGGIYSVLIKEFWMDIIQRKRSIGCLEV